jgi:fucose 4-O-acetylase-like acetyltransferase
LKERALRLIVPYFFFNIIFYIFILIVKTEEHSFTSVLVGTLYGSWLRGNPEIFLLNVSTWFLIALFLASIFYFLINKFIKNKIHKLIFLIIISIFVYIDSIYFKNLRLPFSLEPALMAVFFY